LPMGEGWGEGSTPDDIFWTSASWQVVSTAAAAIVLNEAVNYEQTLLIANDIPFLHAPAIVERAKRDFQVQIQSLIALYGSSYIHLRDAIDPARLTWEQSSLGTPAIYPDIKLAHYSNFMRRHFVERYAVEESHFVPYASSLTIEHDDFAPLREDQIERILCRYGIPLDRPLILAFGRADRVKGFDILLNSLDAVRDRVHLVLNVVPYVPNAPIIGEYCTAIREHGLKVTLLKEYSRALPMALSQWKKTRIVVCPSRGEPLSNIPFEVSLWARDQGPVLLCSNVDGFPEQIEHGVNGFLFDVDAKGELEASIAQILRLDDETCSVIRRNAYERVVRERDFYRNFREMLRCYWRG
ncbi:MAG: glycosyltransferase family 4 protein, partial [Dehalococcoidia bacterium]